MPYKASKKYNSKRIDADLKQIILRMKGDGFSAKEIAKTLDLNVPAVFKCLKREQQVAGLPPKIKVPKEKMTGPMKRTLKYLVLNNPHIQGTALKKAFS